MNKVFDISSKIADRFLRVLLPSEEYAQRHAEEIMKRYRNMW